MKGYYMQKQTRAILDELISKNLITIRKKNKKTQEQIAKVLNTSSGGYAHYENSRYLIPTNFIYNLALYYKNFSIDKILGRKEKVYK